MRLHRIAFAFSSRTIARTERYIDDSTPFIPISIPALYPIRINKNLSFYTRTSSSLTRLERAVKMPVIPGTRRKRAKRIPFLRCNTSSMLNLRVTAASSGSDLIQSPEINQNFIDETAKFICTTSMPEDAKKESSRDRLSKQIKHLRSKFHSVGEENNFATEFDRNSDVDPVTMNLKKERNFKEAKTTGNTMTTLLIESIQNMLLENIGNTDPISIFPNDEQPNEEIQYDKCRESPHENADSNVQVEEQKQDVASSIDETEMSSSDDNNSTGDESSEDTASYNILDDSKYSLDRDSEKTEDSSSLQEKIPIAHSSMESCTDSTLQMELTNRSPSNPNLASIEDTVLRNNAIPIITVDIQESTDSSAPIDTSELSNGDRPDITSFFTPKSTYSSDKREIDDVRQASDTSGNKRQTLILEEVKWHSSATSGLSIPATHRVHLTKHERDLCRERNQSTHQQNRRSMQVESLSPTEGSEDRMNMYKERKDSSTNLPHTTTQSSLSNEEARTVATIERRRYMRDLIKLIDTKMMVSTRTCHSKRIISLRRKRERKISRKGKSRNSFDKFPSRGSSTKKRASHKHLEKDVLLRVPRVHSIPECLSLRQHPVLHATSRSCGSSLVSLIDRTCVSPSPASHRPLDGLSGISRKSPKDYKPDTSVSSVCNLGETSCHIDYAMPTNNANMTYNSRVSRPSPNLRQQDEASVSPPYPLPAVSTATTKMSQSPATKTLANMPLHRRSSDSDLSVTPKGELFHQTKDKTNSR